MFIKSADNPKLILYSQSPGMLLKYWASLNVVGIYNVTPCSLWTTLIAPNVCGKRYDLLLYDHLADHLSLKERLTILEKRTVARQIVVLADIEPTSRIQLLSWTRDKGIALLDIVNPPMDSRTLMGVLNKRKRPATPR